MEDTINQNEIPKIEKDEDEFDYEIECKFTKPMFRALDSLSCNLVYSFNGQPGGINISEIAPLTEAKTIREYINIFCLDKIGTTTKNLLAKSMRNAVCVEFLINYLEETGRFVVDKRYEQFNDSIYYLHEYRLMKIYSDEFVRKFFIPELYESCGKENLLHRIAFRMDSFLRIDIRKNQYYDRNENVIYFSDRQRGYYRISKNYITHHNNSEYDIYFTYQTRDENICVDDFLSHPELIENSFLSFIETYNFESMIEKQNAQKELPKLLYAFLLACVFESTILEKPITVFSGQQGSGKTTLARMMMQFITSKKADVHKVSDKEEDLDILLTNTSFAVIDNKESNPPFLQDSLATAATSGTKRKRKLYTTNDYVDYVYNCFIIVTSMNPKFRRADIVDRMIIIYFKRIEKFVGTSSFQFDDLQLKEFYSAFFIDLQMMLRILDTPDIDNNDNYRLADFFRILRTGLMIQSPKYEVDQILENLSKSLQSYIEEDNEILNMTKDILSCEVENPKDAGDIPYFLDDEMSSAKIFSIYQAAGLSNKISQKALINQLSSLKTNLENTEIIFEKRIGHGNKRSYIICKKDDYEKIVEKINTKKNSQNQNQKNQKKIA
jgi:energy-coupling factor transporter ATP-binding protein EcfA2